MNKKCIGQIIITLLLLGLSGCSSTSTSQKIAFKMSTEGVGQIYVMNFDGSDVQKITATSHQVSCPVWSPDKNKIAFTVSEGQSEDIYIVNPDGGKLINLTDNGARNSPFAWSPDGTQIVFSTNLGGMTSDIFIMNSNGTHQQDLYGSSEGYIDAISWSPNGQQILFTEAMTVDNKVISEIYIMNKDGSNLINLLDNAANNVNPIWSPDGENIAFISISANQEGILGNIWDIYVMDVNGEKIQNLTNNENGNQYSELAWSPDGEKIAYVVNDNSLGYQIFIIDRNGENTLNLTNTEKSFSYGSISWSSDGQKILFSSDREGYSNIFTMNADGSDVLNLTNNQSLNFCSTW